MCPEPPAAQPRSTILTSIRTSQPLQNASSALHRLTRRRSWRAQSVPVSLRSMLPHKVAPDRGRHLVSQQGRSMASDTIFGSGSTTTTGCTVVRRSSIRCTVVRRSSIHTTWHATSLDSTGRRSKPQQRCARHDEQGRRALVGHYFSRSERALLRGWVWSRRQMHDTGDWYWSWTPGAGMPLLTGMPRGIWHDVMCGPHNDICCLFRFPYPPPMLWPPQSYCIAAVASLALGLR